VTFFQLNARFMRKQWRAYALAAAMLAGVTCLTVWVPLKVGRIVDGIAQGRYDSVALLADLGFLLLAGVTIYFLRVGWRFQLFGASHQLAVEVRNQLYRQLAQQGPTFFDSRRTGDLMALATNDIDALEMAAGEGFLAGFDGTLTLIAVLATMMVLVDWRLGLAALLPFPFMALAFWWISQRVHSSWQTSLDRFGDLNDHVQETLTGVRTIRALGLEPRSDQTLSALAKQCADTSFLAQKWEAAYEPAVGSALAVANTIALAVGGWLFWHNELTLGQLTTFSMFLGHLIWPMFAMGWVMSLIERGRAAWLRLEPVMYAPPATPDAGRHPDPPTGEIRLAQVSFQYANTQQPALQDISLTLPPGKTLGIVGPTGAGKSTLLKLLLRLYEPDRGTLTWGSIPLSAYPLTALRAATAWVPQEAFLFSDSVAANIALACPDATSTMIARAATDAAVADDIARLPQGYATPVGERGVTLSGGQKQRVAIARALVTDARLILLDDVLSAVDTGTETRIRERLAELRAAAGSEGRSVVIVTHRLSSVADADHIVVLQHGRIVEAGDHASLLAANQWYAAQWRYQQLEESLDRE
jgi:ATP-binding cassette, subfamily B, multidrug efflux pump